MDEEVTTPKKIRLRRVGSQSTASRASSVFDDELIQKNLEPLRENIEKKRRAQEAYYENHSESFGVSPLTRDFHKRPVKQRLGRSNIPYAGTSTSFLPPKQRLRKANNTPHNRTNFRSNTLNNRINSRRPINNFAQQRLYRIRTRNQDAVAHQTTKSIRLRRPGGFTSAEPKNFQVQVMNSIPNHPNYSNVNSRGWRRFKQILNTQIQVDIKKIQLQFTGTNTQPTKVTPAFTLLSLHDRFARLK